MNKDVQISLRDLKEIVKAADAMGAGEWALFRLSRASLDKDVPYDRKAIGRIGNTDVKVCTGSPANFYSIVWPSEQSSISFGSGGSERMNMSNPFLHDSSAWAFRSATTTDSPITLNTQGTAITGASTVSFLATKSPSTTEKTMTVHHYALIELEDGDPTGVILDTTMVAVVHRCNPASGPTHDSRDLAIAKFAKTAKGSLLQDWDVVKVQ